MEYLQKNMTGSYGAFIQFMGDNVDVNSTSIDGRGSLHAMGLCCATTSSGGKKTLTLEDPVKREKKKKRKRSKRSN